MSAPDTAAQPLAERIRTAVAHSVVGNARAVDELLVALLCRGHVLLEDVPGVGKTLLARSLAAALGCDFHRVQLTPDVLPSDVTGSNIFSQKTGGFVFLPGPVFTQVLLADEINRATPRTQASLLESMEERQVTTDGETRMLPDPFFVLATQNPIDLEGTFPLPEAQLDRFMVCVRLGYPTRADEDAVLQRYETDDRSLPVAVTTPAEILAWQRARGEVVVSPDLRGYLLDVVRATRDDERIQLGASPRAALALHRAVQAWALLRDRTFALPDDVKELAATVLAHRLVLTAQARLAGERALGVIESALERVAVPVEVERTAADQPGDIGEIRA